MILRLTNNSFVNSPFWNKIFSVTSNKCDIMTIQQTDKFSQNSLIRKEMSSFLMGNSFQKLLLGIKSRLLCTGKIRWRYHLPINTFVNSYSWQNLVFTNTLERYHLPTERQFTRKLSLWKQNLVCYKQRSVTSSPFAKRINSFEKLAYSEESIVFFFQSKQRTPPSSFSS